MVVLNAECLGSISVLQIPFLSDRASHKVTLWHRFFPFASANGKLRSFNPPEVEDPVIPAAVPPPRNYTKPDTWLNLQGAISDISYHSGHLYVHNPQLFMTKVFPLDSETGLPKRDAKGNLKFTVYSLGVERVSGLSIESGGVAYVSSDKDKVTYQMKFDMATGYSYCDAATAQVDKIEL